MFWSSEEENRDWVGRQKPACLRANQFSCMPFVKSTKGGADSEFVLLRLLKPSNGNATRSCTVGLDVAWTNWGGIGRNNGPNVEL